MDGKDADKIMLVNFLFCNWPKYVCVHLSFPFCNMVFCVLIESCCCSNFSYLEFVTCYTCLKVCFIYLELKSVFFLYLKLDNVFCSISESSVSYLVNMSVSPLIVKHLRGTYFCQLLLFEFRWSLVNLVWKINVFSSSNQQVFVF